MADYTFIDNTGVIIPDAATIGTEVQNEFIALFGDDLNVTSPNTPQGLLITAETLARIAIAANNAALANQINPNFAGGVFFDAIMGLTGSQRRGASNSQVLVTLGGVVGTIIPAGAQAQDSNGNNWQNVSQVTLTASTITNVLFQAVDPGPTTVAANALIIIVSNILGWTTITNPAVQFFTGQATQSDANARLFRNNTLYLQGNSLAGSVIATLNATQGVTSIGFAENISSSPATVRGVDMSANSIYVCVAGTATNINIAGALTASKGGGCGYSNGASSHNVSFNYTVPISNQVITVLWDAPDLITIYMQVTAVITTPIQNPIATIQQAILNYAAGNVSGLAGFVVGGNVSAFEISAAIGIQYPGIYISNLLLSTDNMSFSAATITIDIWQLATVIANNITVSI